MAEISLQEYCEQIDNTIEQGRYAEAVAHGKHILKSYPKHTATYRLLGKAMLEAGQDEYATNMFRRTLSADPEDLVAWVGMSEVYSRRGELDAAIWCLEQAFALATDNQVLEEELRHLYSRRDGVEPQRIQLTHGALARLYLRGDLLSRAIAEFRALLVKHPERVDLNVALAEALWRNEQRLEASEVCQQVLNELPYSLKANLLLGEIWTSSGREEGQVYLRQAEALDPDNQMAQEIFGTRSPLPKRQVRITPLEYKHPTEKERPAWMTEVEAASEEPPLSEREATLVDITAALEARIEIPTWLEEIVDEETAEPVPPSIAEPSAEQPPEEVVSAPAEEIPEWLADTYEESIEEKAKAIAEEKTTEWPAEESLEIISPDKVPAAPGEVKIPDWLTELGIEAADEDSVPSVAEPAAPPAEEAFGWTAFGEPEVPPEVEIPAVEEAAPVEEAAVPAPVAEAPLPAWIEGEGMPSGDDALAWLKQLAEGKEEELRAQAEAEGEIRMAEIMGRPTPAETPSEETSLEAVVSSLIEEPAAPPAEEAFGWTAFGEPEVPPEVEIPAVEEAAPVEEAAVPAPVAEAPLPAWMEGEGMPSGDDALAWLEQLAEGKEEELRAQAEAEGEIRMAEIMGRPTPAEIPPEETSLEAVVSSLIEEPAAPPAEEAFGWTAFGEPEVPPEVEIPAVEEAAPVEEAAEPAPVAEAPLPAWMEGEGMPSGDDALAWMEQLAEGKEEELRAQAEAEGEIRMAEIMGRPTPAETPSEETSLEAVVSSLIEEPAAPPAKEAFGWTAFGEPEVPPEVEIPAVEEATPIEEAAEPRGPEEIEAPPVVEIPVVEEEPPLEVTALEILPEELVPTPAVEESLGVTEIEMEMPKPIEETAAMPEVPAAEVTTETFTVEREYLKKHPRDYETWLALARALWQANEQEEALEIYTRVIRAGKFLEGIITTLERYVEQQPDVSTQRVLGDAYMKDDRLQDALDIYRQTLEDLENQEGTWNTR